MIFSFLEWFPFDYWSAPELAEDPKAFTHKSDIWAFGILGFVIFNRGEEPYKSQFYYSIVLISDHIF